MVMLKDPAPPPYVPRLDFEGKEETAVSLLGKTVKFEQQTGDDEGLVRDFNPKTGMSKVQLFSGKVVSIMRTEFETVENLVRKREKRARDAISDKYASLDDDNGSINGYDGATVTSLQSGSIVIQHEDGENESENGDDDDNEDDEENDLKNMGEKGKNYMNGEDRYSSIALKYDKFRSLLQAAKADRNERKPGRSVLDDLESIADDKSTTTGSVHSSTTLPQVLGKYGSKTSDGSVTSLSSNKTLWSFGSIQNRIVQESTDVLLRTTYKRRKPPPTDQQSKAESLLFDKFKKLGEQTISPPQSPIRKSNAIINTGVMFPGENEEANLVPHPPYTSPVKHHSAGPASCLDDETRVMREDDEIGFNDSNGIVNFIKPSDTPSKDAQKKEGTNGLSRRVSNASSHGVVGGVMTGVSSPTNTHDQLGGVFEESSPEHVLAMPISEWGEDASPLREAGKDEEELEEQGAKKEEEVEYDYVFPIIIEKLPNGSVVTRWAPGSDVELPLNKGDNLKHIAIQFVIKHDLPGAVSDSVLDFLEHTLGKDPSSAFSRQIIRREVKHDKTVAMSEKEEEDDFEEEDEQHLDGKPVKLTGAELDIIDAKEAALVEKNARRPNQFGGTPHRHPKRHDVHGSTRPLNYNLKEEDKLAGFRGGDNGGGDEKYLKEDDDKKKLLEKNKNNEKNSVLLSNNMSMNMNLNNIKKANENNGENEAEATEEDEEEVNRKKNQFAPTTAFMVLAVLRKGRKDADRVALSLKTILTDVSATNDGCELLVKHKALELVIEIAELHWMDVKIQVLACLILRNLLVGHAPLRRSEMLLTSSRAHLKRLLKIKQVVESCIDGFRIMATESCKIAAIEDTVVRDLSIFDFVLALASSIERADCAQIVYPALRFMALVVGLRQRPACKQLVLGNGVYFALSCLQVHSDNPQLMTAALRLLVLAARIDGDVTTGGPSPNHGVADAVSKVRLPPKHKSNKNTLLGLGRTNTSSENFSNEVKEEYSLKTKPVAKLEVNDITDDDIAQDKDVELVHPVEVILHTMMRLHSDSKLQLGGTELIRTLIENEDARVVLDGIPGGLDWLCQGPDEGNVLIHWREGALKNKGWAFGEQTFHTGSAEEYLWEGTDAIANLNRPMAEMKLGSAIEADDFGIPTKSSIHAHQELASMHHVVREYSDSEHHYALALKKTDAMIAEAQHDVYCQRSTIKAAKAAGVDILPPIHVHHNGKGDASAAASGDDENFRRPKQRDSTVVGTLGRKVHHFDDSEGGELSFKLAKAEKDLEAAQVRKDIIIANRNMMRRDHKNGAEFSERLELWNPLKLNSYLVESEYHVPKPPSPLSLSAPKSSIWSSAASASQDVANKKKINDDNSLHGRSGSKLVKEDVPLKLPYLTGSKHPPHWETFNDDSLHRHFNVYKRLALLPMYGENVQDWRKRIRFWEKEAGTTVAMLAMVERDKEYPGLFPM